MQIIQEMKNENFKKRPSIDKTLEKLVLYCDEKNYSDSIDIVPYLKEKKTFVQTPFNEDLSSLATFKPKMEEFHSINHLNISNLNISLGINSNDSQLQKEKEEINN